MNRILTIFVILATIFVGIKFVNTINSDTSGVPPIERKQSIIELYCGDNSYRLYKPENTIGYYYDTHGNQVTMKDGCDLSVQRDELVMHPSLDNEEK